MLTAVSTDPSRTDSDPIGRTRARRGLLAGVLILGLVACKSADRSAEDAAVETTTKKITPKRQVVDVHVHVTPDELDRLHGILDEAGIDWVVNLSGMWPGGPLEKQLAAARQSGRIRVATTPPWGLAFRRDDFPTISASMIRDAKRQGAVALKISKALGLQIKNPKGELVAVDDPWLDPIWAAAGEVGFPVFIHTADPKAFWLPIDENNERQEELTAHPGWSYYGEDVPSFDALLGQLMNVVKKHPKTTFIAVHFGNHAEDPFWVGRMLDEHPNLYVDIAARVVELGRHDPKKLRAVFIEHRKRILFGSDLGVTPRGGLMLGSFGEEPNRRDEVGPFFAAHWRWLETADTLDSPTPIQGRWKIHGLELPSDVLDDIYHGNAERLFGAPAKP